MQRYILRRLLWIVPVLLFVSLLTFGVMKLTPGGPWDRQRQRSPDLIARLNRKYGLDQPLHIQYLTYLWNAARGDFGPSFTHQGREVTAILREGLPATLALGALASAVALAVGFPLGVVAAVRRNTWADYLCLALSLLGASLPGFVLGIGLMSLFAVTLRWLPTQGWGDPRHVVLPALALGLPQAGYLARMTRAGLLEVLRQDYVRTARAKGLQERVVLTRHLLRNALVPLLTVLGPLLASLLTGSFIVETLFAVPGVGRLFVESIGQRDYSLIMATTLLYATAIALLNLLVDVAYALVDPRVAYR